jgi:hypothetical protein
VNCKRIGLAGSFIVVWAAALCLFVTPGEAVSTHRLSKEAASELRVGDASRLERTALPVDTFKLSGSVNLTLKAVKAYGCPYVGVNSTEMFLSATGSASDAKSGAELYFYPTAYGTYRLPKSGAVGVQLLYPNSSDGALPQFPKGNYHDWGGNPTGTVTIKKGAHGTTGSVDLTLICFSGPGERGAGATEKIVGSWNCSAGR